MLSVIETIKNNVLAENIQIKYKKKSLTLFYILIRSELCKGKSKFRILNFIPNSNNYYKEI